MTTSLFDRPTHSSDRTKVTRGIGNYDYNDNDPRYDAVKSAEDKYYNNPDKYATVHSSHGRHTYERNPTKRVNVVIEHWHGCTNAGVKNDIEQALEDNYPDVKVVTLVGRFDAFEVFVNGKTVYSRIMQGGYPYVDEVLDAVHRARKGKEVYQLDRGSSACVIL